jgi:hypothetical protein
MQPSPAASRRRNRPRSDDPRTRPSAESRCRLAAERLRDDRSRRVAFVSHCLLNENTRYLGGAFRPGAVAEFVAELVDHDIGICQMPCPELLDRPPDA